MAFSVFEFAYTVLGDAFMWGAATVAILMGAALMTKVLFDIFDLVDGG